MDFSFNDDQQALIGLADQILTEKATHESLRAIERAGTIRFDADLWSALGEAGLIGVAVPEEFGGSGMGFLEVAAIVEKVGKTVAPVPYLETTVFGVLPIVAHGTTKQKQALLPKLGTGELIVTAALLENLREPAEPGLVARADGDEFVLDGSKIAVRAGQLADKLLVPAKTDGGVTVFLVDRLAAGVVVQELETTTRQPEADLVFSGVRVSAGDVLGTVDGGAAIVSELVLLGNAALCAYAVGICEEALAMTAEYTKTRKQFDQPIAMFQAVGHRMADAYIDTEAVRLTARQAAWRIGAGLPSEAAVAIAKYYASAGGDRIVHAAQHLHGGVGVDRDYPLHRFFLAARHLQLSLGGETRQLQNLGRLLAREGYA
jgi:alkylation response protein AidB-like acyl-CoA dehydrogenase